MKFFLIFCVFLSIAVGQDNATCGEGCHNDREILSTSCGSDCISYSFPRNGNELPAVSNILLKIPTCVSFTPTESAINASFPYVNQDITINSECTAFVSLIQNYQENNPNCDGTRDDFDTLSVVQIEFSLEDCVSPINITMQETQIAAQCPMGLFLGFKAGSNECCSCDTDGLVCPTNEPVTKFEGIFFCFFSFG